MALTLISHDFFLGSGLPRHREDELMLIPYWFYIDSLGANAVLEKCIICVNSFPHHPQPRVGELARNGRSEAASRFIFSILLIF